MSEAVAESGGCGGIRVVVCAPPSGRSGVASVMVDVSVEVEVVVVLVLCLSRL